MRLRQAIKICRELFDGQTVVTRTARGERFADRLPLLRRFDTNRKAIELCRRKWRHRRVPYIPDDDELREQVELSAAILHAACSGELETWLINDDLPLTSEL